jgi:putative ABC transport system permease protein
MDPDQPVFGVTTLDAMLAERGAQRRFVLVLLGAFAAVAVTLAAVGLYGVMAYAVGQRGRELAVRVALGATPAGVRRAVVARGVRLAGAGVALGTAAALAGGRLLTGALYGVSATDPAVLGGVAALLVAVAALASYAPARRATRVDPAGVLRGE